MAKDPAMLWYWSDWYSGTVLMSRFMKGCYMDLLHAQFNSGRLSLEEIKTCLGPDFGQSWLTLQKKFKQDQNGLFFNERLEREKEKRAAFTRSRKENLSKSVHMEPHMITHMVTHMDNENENKDENKIEKGVQGEKQSTWEVEKYSFLHSGGWVYQFCTSKGINQEAFDLLAAEFISDVELREDFKTAKELRSHFTNWYNSKNKTNGNESNKTHRSNYPKTRKTDSDYAGGF